MLATAVIVFREVLEAALIISIVMAACAGVRGRNLWVGGGAAAGLIGSCVVAALAGVIAEMAAGLGQELLNAAILFIAVGMLGWHSIWMSRHGRELAAEMKSVGTSVLSGQRPLYAIAVAVGMAVLREGSETVMFLYGVAQGSETSVADVATGGALGAVLGICTGALLYFGLLSIPTRLLFTVTNWMILLVTAGLAAQAVGFLVQADLVPPLANPLWDTSSVLTEHSLPGKLLHSLVGYQARPAGIQVLAYVVVLAALGSLTFAMAPRVQPRRLLVAAGAVVAAMLVLALFEAQPAHAEFKLRYPNIDYREVEVENNFSATFDRRADKNHNLSFPTEVGVGILPFWFAEVEFEASKEPGERASFEALTFENYFMLTEPGKYWLDFTIFAEYARARKADDADSVMLGALLQKEQGRFLHTANLYWEKEVGSLASNRDGFKYAWQSRYMLNPLFQPGFEVYGEIEDLNRPGTFNEQQFRLGPMFAGSYNLGEIGGRGKIKYEMGYLFGTTSATEERTLRTRFEYEIPF